MQGIWYGDRRDRVKWGALVHIAKQFGLASILQVAYFRDSFKHGPRTDDCEVEIIESVWKHFSDLVEIERLSDTLGVAIKVHGATFNPRKRDEYLKDVRGALEKCPQPRLVFLDPDTGIEPDVLKAEHAATRDMKNLWDALLPGEVLAVYQHAARQGDWIAKSMQRMASACCGSVIRVVQGTVARDVAILWAKKDA